MYKDILDLMCCPACRSGFRLEAVEVEGDEVTEGSLTCGEGHRYAIRRGVVDFCSKEQTMGNQWSETYKEADYETLDQEIESTKSEAEKRRQESILDAMVSELADMKQGLVVDIASGRGMLLTKLVRTLQAPVHVLATDLSFAVLMYDRLKVRKINPDLHVTYLACDATALPLKSGVSDAAVSFFGIANMAGIVDKGLQEAARILKPGGKLINTLVMINENSKGFEALSQVCAQNQMDGAEKVYLREESTKLHSAYFSEADCRIVCEDIKEGTENPLDLLPYPGEWFAYALFRCR